MSNYNAKKKADLEVLLKERGLSHTGNKPDLVARLQEDDAKKATSEAAAPASTAAEDELDFGDTLVEASDPANQAALDAGGQGPVANPVAVPNQVQVEDPAKDDSLTVQAPVDGDGEAPQTSVETNKQDTAEEAAAKKAAEEARFAAGLASSTADTEAEKRRKRAERFGIVQSEEDKKADERAKRFGTDAVAGDKVVGILDRALPERQDRKRGRDRNDVGASGRGGRVEKRVDSRRRNGGGRSGGGGGGGGAHWSDRDREAMRKRAERFGAKA